MSSAHLLGVDFVNATDGWAVGYYYAALLGEQSVILATTNGGATWKEQSWGSGAWLYDVAFVDERHGWIAGNSMGGGGEGPILATSDGGVTWSKQTPGISSLYGIAFSDATHGWAVGKGGTILATTNGGGASLALAKLKPASGKRGAIVTVTGTGFGAKSGASSVKFGATKCAKYLSWSATQIKCTVPAKAKYGKVSVTVTTTAGKSNAMSFTVKH